MTPDFFDRFAARRPHPPVGLQLLYGEPPEWDAALAAALRDYHPDLAAATAELVRVAGNPAAAGLVSADGPPASALGLLAWGEHVVKLAGFDVPMPYGPVEACVLPAMMDPNLKAEAKRHTAHALLYYAGTAADPLERYVALAAAAGALARFGAAVVMNEEARAAQPATDLLPEPGEDALHTLRTLPLPYLYAGFLRLDVGDGTRVWVRTFAAHRLGLPNLAYRTADPADVRRAFALFSGMLGYLRQTGESFAPGDAVDLGDGSRLGLRAPTELEWFLDSDGPMLVVEPLPG